MVLILSGVVILYAIGIHYAWRRDLKDILKSKRREDTFQQAIDDEHKELK